MFSLSFVGWRTAVFKHKTAIQPLPCCLSYYFCLPLRWGWQGPETKGKGDKWGNFRFFTQGKKTKAAGS